MRYVRMDWKSMPKITIPIETLSTTCTALTWVSAVTPRACWVKTASGYQGPNNEDE